MTLLVLLPVLVQDPPVGPDFDAADRDDEAGAAVDRMAEECLKSPAVEEAANEILWCGVDSEKSRLADDLRHRREGDGVQPQGREEAWRR